MMLDFADERITNSVDKGKRVKDCCNLVSSTTAEASWKTRKRWIQNISRNRSPTVIDRYEQGSTLGIPLDSLLFKRCMYLGFEIFMSIYHLVGGETRSKIHKT